jgi:hypothetical protein
MNLPFSDFCARPWYSEVDWKPKPHARQRLTATFPQHILPPTLRHTWHLDDRLLNTVWSLTFNGSSTTRTPPVLMSCVRCIASYQSFRPVSSVVCDRHVKHSETYIFVRECAVDFNKQDSHVGTYIRVKSYKTCRRKLEDSLPVLQFLPNQTCLRAKEGHFRHLLCHVVKLNYYVP